jgi:hypothetical protein
MDELHSWSSWYQLLNSSKAAGSASRVLNKPAPGRVPEHQSTCLGVSRTLQKKQSDGAAAPAVTPQAHTDSKPVLAKVASAVNASEESRTETPEDNTIFKAIIAALEVASITFILLHHPPTHTSKEVRQKVLEASIASSYPYPTRSQQEYEARRCKVEQRQCWLCSLPRQAPLRHLPYLFYPPHSAWTGRPSESSLAVRPNWQPRSRCGN